MKTDDTKLFRLFQHTKAMFVPDAVINPGETISTSSGGMYEAIQMTTGNTKEPPSVEQKNKSSLKYGCEVQKDNLFIAPLYDPLVKFSKNTGVAKGEIKNYVIASKTGKYLLKKIVFF